MKRLVAMLLVFVPQLVFGWGQDGHRIVAYVGSQLAFKGSMFWTANAENMRTLTSIPDLKWKMGQLYRPETVTHFFQPDSYFKNPAQFGQIPRDFSELSSRFGTQNAINYGSSPWRANQFYQMALAALKHHDFQTAVVAAGIMSHYIGDMSQPLHVTENYDGQMTNDKGIHKYFETANVALHVDDLTTAATTGAKSLLQNPQFQRQFDGNVIDETFAESFRAYALKDKIIQTDLKMGRSGAGAKAQLQLASVRLADGAATLAVVLSQLWTESGLGDTGASGQVPTPEWIKPDYYGTNALDASYMDRAIIDDDCGE